MKLIKSFSFKLRFQRHALQLIALAVLINFAVWIISCSLLVSTYQDRTLCFKLKYKLKEWQEIRWYKISWGTKSLREFWRIAIICPWFGKPCFLFLLLLLLFFLRLFFFFQRIDFCDIQPILWMHLSTYWITVVLIFLVVSALRLAVLPFRVHLCG